MRYGRSGIERILAAKFFVTFFVTTLRTSFEQRTFAARKSLSGFHFPIRQAGFDAKAGAERRPAHRDRESERAIEMNPRPLAPEASSRRSYAIMSAQIARFLWFDDHWRSQTIIGVVTILVTIVLS